MGRFLIVFKQNACFAEPWRYGVLKNFALKFPQSILLNRVKRNIKDGAVLFIPCFNRIYKRRWCRRLEAVS